MPLEQFIATSAADAAQQIRSRLGADAVVVNIRQLPGRWFQKPRIEVLARRTEQTTESAPSPIGEDLRTAPGQLTAGFPFEQENLRPASVHGQESCAPSGFSPKIVANAMVEQRYGRADASLFSRCASAPEKAENSGRALLESVGLLPLVAERVLEHMPVTQPPWLAGELKQVRAALTASWIPCKASPATGLHVFVGAPGVGKTTALCKWLTVSVLLQARKARVWRLDAGTANTAESLSVHGDILGVPVERSWTGHPISEEIAFVDLPGTEWSDATAINALADKLRTMPVSQTHLVVNAAYDATVLLEQVRAFARMPISDLIVTHLDEEPHWGKLWNLVLGTGLPIRFLSAGQNIPGEFREADVERVLMRLFPFDLEHGRTAALG
jgi:flagellar biosynthesis protein FlhF